VESAANGSKISTGEEDVESVKGHQTCLSLEAMKPKTVLSFLGHRFYLFDVTFIGFEPYRTLKTFSREILARGDLTSCKYLVLTQLAAPGKAVFWSNGTNVRPAVGSFSGLRSLCICCDLWPLQWLYGTQMTASG